MYSGAPMIYVFEEGPGRIRVMPALGLFAPVVAAEPGAQGPHAPEAARGARRCRRDAIRAGAGGRRGRSFQGDLLEKWSPGRTGAS
eukprot:8439815-Pyramimonas_sp.AAC.1